MNIDAVAERLAGIISDRQDAQPGALSCCTLELLIAEELRKETEQIQGPDLLTALRQLLVAEKFDDGDDRLTAARAQAETAIAAAEGR